MSVVDNLLLFRCVQIVRRLTQKSREIGIFCNISGDTLADREFFPQFLDYMRVNRDLAGHKDKARATLDKLMELNRKDYVSPAYISIAYIGLGNRDKVFEWADKCIEQRAALLVRLKVEPVVDTVRDDARFAKLTDKVNVH